MNILVKYLPNICIETIFIKAKMSQANEPPKFVLNLSQRIELRSLNKHAALKNVSVGKDNTTKLMNSKQKHQQNIIILN